MIYFVFYIDVLIFIGHCVGIRMSLVVQDRECELLSYKSLGKHPFGRSRRRCVYNIIGEQNVKSGVDGPTSGRIQWRSLVLAEPYLRD